MDTNTVDIELIVTKDFWAFVSRAAAALKMTPEAFVLEASVASAIKQLSCVAHTIRGGVPPRRI